MRRDANLNFKPRWIGEVTRSQLSRCSTSDIPSRRLNANWESGEQACDAPTEGFFGRVGRRSVASLPV